MITINYTAVRAFARLMEPVFKAHDEAERADAGFDGGEWSSAWHGQSLRNEMNKYADIVGARFGMSGELLLEQFVDVKATEDNRRWGVLDWHAMRIDEEPRT